MKKSNKLIIISACLFLVSFSLVLSSFLKAGYENKDRAEDKISTRKEENEKTLKTENNISEPVSPKIKKNSYVIRISDNRICAFIITENGEILWNASDIPPGLGFEERKALEEGIYSDSFEEMCLYLESYSS